VSNNWGALHRKRDYLRDKKTGAEQMPNIGGIVKTLQNIMRKDAGVCEFALQTRYEKCIAFLA